MKFYELIRMALAGISSNKFRTFLTLLGIIIGVASVIMMVFLGSSTQEVVGGQLADLQIRQMIISPNYNLGYAQRIRMTLDDGVLLKEATVGVKEVLPFVNYYHSIEYQDQEKHRTVYGVMPKAKDLTGIELKAGRFIIDSDVANRERVVVLGERFLQQLIDLPDYSHLIGEQIEIDQKKFTIVGIIGKVDKMTVVLSYNSVVVPLTTARELWDRWNREIRMFLISYDNATTEQDIRAQVAELLTAKYGKTSFGKDRYQIEGLAQTINIVSTIILVFTYLLGGIAGISLIVGGIGVMNIMLVTVKERTKEIGIRLAIGATQKDVQYQFLLEATMMSIGGGILGIIIGSVLSFVINLVLGNMFDWWQGSLPSWVILVSFGFTVLIGIIFGFYPAYKAAKLDPIEALRHE